MYIFLLATRDLGCSSSCCWGWSNFSTSNCG